MSKIYTIFKETDHEFTGNVRDISKHFNINYIILYNRIKLNNLSIEEAIEIHLTKLYQNNLTYKSKKGSIKELRKIFNKNYIEVYNKVKCNHTFELAMDSTSLPFGKE